jgi:hypothetical protein
MGAEIGSDTPNATIPLTGEANTGSLDTTAGGYASVGGKPFVFHDPTVGGAPSDATLEWFFKTPQGTGHSSLFWTSNGGAGDGNRFNIFWHLNGNDVVAGDFSGPDGAGAAIGVFDNGNTLDTDTWHHVAIVRTETGGGNGGQAAPSFDWKWFIDGVESEAHATTTTLAMPNTFVWLIAGRGKAGSFRGLMDEVRMTGRALTPGEFLIGGDPTGACCTDGSCDVQTQANCVACGGTYQG